MAGGLQDAASAEYLDQLRPEDRGQTYDFVTADPRKPQTKVAVEQGPCVGLKPILILRDASPGGLEVRLPPTRSQGLPP